MLEAIEEIFDSFGKFVGKFSKAATTLFGSECAWLVNTLSGKLEIVKESNAGNPMRSCKKPLLTCDVWEHAYNLDHQNRRPDYIESFWKVVDWEKVQPRL